MAEWTYALASVAELKTYAGISGTGQDALLEGILKRTSEAIEAFLGRRIVSRSTIAGGVITADAVTEYHTAQSHIPSLLYLGQYPIRLVSSVAEGYLDGAGTWTVASPLTVNVDFDMDTEAGTLTRLSSANAGAWAEGYKRVRVVYAGGYETTAAVTGPIKEVALGVARRKYAMFMRGVDGSVQSVSDAMGSVTRFLPGDLLNLDREALAQFQRFLCTGRAA